MIDLTLRFGTAPRRSSLDEHLRVEVIDAGHPQWPAVRQRLVRSVWADRWTLMVLEPDGRLSARQAVVAAFLDGRVVGHACFRVEPARSADGSLAVFARMDSRVVDAPFAGTAVEHVLLQMAESRARTMGCRGFAAAPGPCRRVAA
jgi:GNAT superfamily N-acetyltransferase